MTYNNISKLLGCKQFSSNELDVGMSFVDFTHVWRIYVF